MPKLKLTFDLMDILNSSNESRQSKKSLASFVKRDAIKREFGNRVIDEIKKRTLKGLDKRDSQFKGAKSQKGKREYSEGYQESLAFRVYGKSKNDINLKLTGKMQASMIVKKTTPTGVELGFASTAQEKKAKGHINGSGSLPVRDFWGIKKEDQVKILKSVIKEFNAGEGQEAADLFSAVSALVSGAELISASAETAASIAISADISLGAFDIAAGGTRGG